MVGCVAWSANYQTTYTNDYGTHRQGVSELIVATHEGLAHFKMVMGFGPKSRPRIFVDLDSTKYPHSIAASEAREHFRKHRQYGMTARAVAKAGSSLMNHQFSDTDNIHTEIFQHTPLAKWLQLDERAQRAWDVITGQDGTPRYEDILDQAKEIAEERRQNHLHQKALAMAEVDDVWGMF